MPNMRKKALPKRASSMGRPVGKAICPKCQEDDFEAIIFDNSKIKLRCYGFGCQAYWTPIGNKPGQHFICVAPMGGGGDEPGDMVQEKG